MRFRRNSLLSSPGQTWSYDLELVPGQTAKLEDGPAGCRLASGKLSWGIPRDARKGVYEILVSTKAQDGKTAYRVVKLVVE